MKVIENWDNVQATTTIENLPAGGYIVQIKNVIEKKNKNTPGSHFEVMFDIADGADKGFFERDYRNQTREDKYWHGIIRQNIPQEGSEKYAMQCSFFKRFITNIEESNPGYHWNWDESTLSGKMCGCIFGEKERQSQKGTVYTTTEATSITTVDTIKKGTFEVPAKKRLNPASTYGATTGFSELTEDDGELPF